MTDFEFFYRYFIRLAILH